MKISSLPFIELASDDRYSMVRLTAQPAEKWSDCLLEYEVELRLPGFVARQPLWLEPDVVSDFQTQIEKLRQGEADRARLPLPPSEVLELEIEASGGVFQVRATLRSPTGREHPARLSGAFTIKRHGLTVFLRQVERAARAMEGPLPAVLLEGEGSWLLIEATGDFESTHLPAVRVYVEARLDGDCSPGNVMTGAQVCWIETYELERLLAALEAPEPTEVGICAMSSEEFSLGFTPPSTFSVEIGALSHCSRVRVQRQISGTFELESDWGRLRDSLRELAQLPFGGKAPRSI